MKIALDARWIFREVTGIGAYTQELLRSLAAMDRRNNYTVLFSNPAVRDRTVSFAGLDQARNFSPRTLGWGVFSPASQLLLPGLLRALDADVYHSTNFMAPLAAFPRNRPGRIRCVVNIHDLVPLAFPNLVPRSKKRRLFPLYKLLMREIAARADVIITGSGAARDQIISLLRVPEARAHRVLAIPDGVSPRFKPAPGAPARPKTFKTILWVGRPDPYKNLPRLVEAFAQLITGHRLPAKLKIVGPRDCRYPEAGRRAAQLGVDSHIIWAGYLSDEELVRAYQDADLFALPSHYEGFGLPVLEAMACGAPVVCSACGALPEVAGDAAIKVGPDDTIGLAEAMRRVLTNPALAADMRRRGFRNAARFSWDKTASLTLKAYELALS